MSQEYVKKIRRRIHQKVKGTAEKPRLCVFRSNNHIYAQIIDDTIGKTLVSSSSLEKSDLLKIQTGSTCEASASVGKLIAKKSLAINITNVVFDRGGRLYHGRIKSLAEAAREEGLIF
jgi:large subunit ribosomal protein L18